MKYSASDAEQEALPNLLGSTSLATVQQAEAEGFLLAEQSLLDELRVDQLFDVAYIQEIHRRALGNVYSFAGRYRTVNLSKGGFTFPAAQHLPQSMLQLERDFSQTLPNSWPDTTALARDVARVHAELLDLFLNNKNRKKRPSCFDKRSMTGVFFDSYYSGTSLLFCPSLPGGQRPYGARTSQYDGL